MARKVSMLGVVCLAALMAAPSAMADCYPVEVLVVVQICTVYHSDGSRVCHYEQEWQPGYECNVWGPGGTLPPPPDPPTLPEDYPPPDCEIVGVSDENPDQPILSIQSNDAVVAMTLAYDGWANQTVGRTDSIAMQPVNYFSTGNTSVAVQCRNVANVYATPVMNVSRTARWYHNSDVVYGVWTEINLLGEPTQGHGEWNRGIMLNTIETSYDRSTVGTRNGLYQHTTVEDQMYRIGDTPKPAWDSRYLLNSWSGGQTHFWGWSCGEYYWQEGVCFDVNAFSTPHAPKGTSVITDLNVPRQGAFFVSILAGKEISVGPQ